MDLFSSCLFKPADKNAGVWSLEGQKISLLIFGRELREYEGFTLPYTFICKCTRIQTNVSPNKKRAWEKIILYKLSEFLSWDAYSGGTYFPNYNSIRELKEILADRKDSFVTVGTSRVRQLLNDASWNLFKVMEYSDMSQSPSKLELALQFSHVDFEY